jgi:hypothetical protein
MAMLYPVYLVVSAIFHGYACGVRSVAYRALVPAEKAEDVFQGRVGISNEGGARGGGGNGRRTGSKKNFDRTNGRTRL